MDSQQYPTRRIACGMLSTTAVIPPFFRRIFPTSKDYLRPLMANIQSASVDLQLHQMGDSEYSFQWAFCSSPIHRQRFLLFAKKWNLPDQ